MATPTSDGAENVIDWNQFAGRGGGAKRERRVRGDAIVGDGVRSKGGAGDGGSVASRDEDPIAKALADGYDPDRFYMASADSKGHQHQIKTINVPQGMAAILAEVREYFPEYRNAQDMVRDALMHRLMYLKQKIDDGEVTEMMVNESLRSKMEYNRVMMQQTKATYEESVGACAQALESKDYGRLDKILQTINDHIHELDERDPYLKAYVDLFIKYGKEMKTARDTGKYTDGPVVSAVDWNMMRGSGLRD